MATRLRTLEIGRKAVKGRHGEQPARPTCSFCSSREEEVFMLVPGLDGAFVCDECVEMLAEELKYAKGG
jgi:ClpX C4-type zinc finger